VGIQDQEERAKQRIIQRQAQAVTRQQTTPRTGTIGKFLPNGKFEVNLPDGGKGQGVKIYNSRHDEGDTVLLSDRGDGTYILDGPKAPPPRKELNIDSLDNRCKGYLKGQIFHCDEERKETIIVWAIEKAASGFYVLRNLITGENYALENPPATVLPCAPPVPGTPQTPPPDPVDPASDKLYLHVWQRWSWGVPTGMVCGPFPTPHPDSSGITSSSTINLQSTIDNTLWTQRYIAGGYTNQGGDWEANSLSTYTSSPTPPPISAGLVDYAVTSNALGYTFVNYFLQVGGPGTPWTYMAAGCPPTADSPPTSPPIDSRDPNGAPIPNVVEVTLSIGENLGPIAHIRHTPNCVSPGVWNSEKSYTLKTNVNGVPQLQTTNGKLTTDWRYKNPAIPCRNTFRSELFTNLDFTGVKLWSIETLDRPASITPGTPTQLKVTNKSLDAGCTATVVGSKLTTAQVTGNLPVTIVAIAVKIIKR
jgi:hypothetical protein